MGAFRAADVFLADDDDPAVVPSRVVVAATASRRRRRSRAFASAAAVTVMLIAAAALAGWHFGIAGLKSVVPGHVPMNPVTALCLLLAGGSLLLFRARRRRPALLLPSRATAMVVGLVALLALSRVVTPWDFGPDRLLFPTSVVTAVAGFPNRMAPTTAVALILLSLGLYLLAAQTRGWRRVGRCATVVAGLTACAVVLGYCYGSRSLYAVGGLIPMAINTALALVLMSIAALCARPGEGLPSLFMSDRLGGTLARRLVPAALFIPIFAGWLRLRGQSAGLYDPAFGLALMVIVTTATTVGLIWLSAVSIDHADRRRGRAEARLRHLNDHLEARVAARTRELRNANSELRAEMVDRLRIEKELTQQRHMLRQVIDANPQLVFIKDRGGRFVLVNQAVADIYGSTTDALLGRGDADFNADPAQVAAFRAADARVISRTVAERFGCEAVTDARTGEVRWFDTVKVPLLNAAGRCEQVLGVATDITARRLAEEKLRRTADELRGWFDASPVALCSLSPAREVVSWNHAAESLFGWPAAEVIGSVLPIIPSGREVEAQGLHDRALNGHPFIDFETQRLHKDGHLVDVSISTAPLHDASGAVCGLTVVYTNIGERMRLEAQLRQSQKMEAVGRLAGGVAHDFNNILTVIHAASEFLLTDLGADDPRHGDAADIRDAADRATVLTRQLLAFSRQQVLHLRPLELNGVVAPLEPMLRRLVEETIEVVIRLAPDLARVKADPGQLDQVILNLVVNARDAMPSGGTILIETANVQLDGEYPRSHLTARPGPHVVLTVTDTGCGMDTDTQARIFEPFFTTKGLGQGTGLGLSTVYGIVKQLGGHVWVYSEVGRGSSFKIYFPVYTGTEPMADVATGRRCAPSPAGGTILLVEDDPAVRRSVRRLLERHDYRVLEAPDGRAALAVIGEAAVTIDLILSDMVMPEMNGLELRRRVRAAGSNVPVLLMSGYSEEAITRLGNVEPLAPLIEKPFTLDGILQKIEDVLTAEVCDV